MIDEPGGRVKIVASPLGSVSVSTTELEASLVAVGVSPRTGRGSTRLGRGLEDRVKVSTLDPERGGKICEEVGAGAEAAVESAAVLPTGEEVLVSNANGCEEQGGGGEVELALAPIGLSLSGEKGPVLKAGGGEEVARRLQRWMFAMRRSLAQQRCSQVAKKVQ
ncbi:hypothetical protein LTR22_028048 [Elasticomyces elasticus]|nr:hypothetical protein LTR22_028048 [Elasticomyces elasticus]